MPNTTLNDAIKEAYASCPSARIQWETLQLKHPSQAEDVFIVKNRENLTLGIEPGGPGTLCGLNPGHPGAEPTAPGTNPGDPGAMPPLPGNEPKLEEYRRVVDGISYSLPPFNRYNINDEPCSFNAPGGTYTHYEMWVIRYNAWQADLGNTTKRDEAAHAASHLYDSSDITKLRDHDIWEQRTADLAQWQLDKADYDAYLARLAAHNAWQDQLDEYNDYLDCIAGETLTKEFTALSFDLTLAASGESGIQELSFSACDVNRAISDWLIAISDSGSTIPVEVIYRVYDSSDTTLPAIDPPLKLYLSEARIDVYTVSARATFADIINRPFPNVFYTRKLFPSLGN